MAQTSETDIMSTVEDLDRQIRRLLPVTRIECVSTSSGRAIDPSRVLLTVTLLDGSTRVQEATSVLAVRRRFLRRLPTNPAKFPNGWVTHSAEETRLATKCDGQIALVVRTLHRVGPSTDKQIAAASELSQANAQKRATDARQRGLIEFAGMRSKNSSGLMADCWQPTRDGLILIGAIVEPRQLSLEAS